MKNKKTTNKGIKSLYIGGHMLNYGSQLQRTMEREKAEEIGVKLYNPMDNKDINDKQANKNDTGLAERIVVADTNAILYSDVIMIEPDPAALGTITELGQIYMFNMMYDIIDNILNNEDLSDRGKINAIKKFYEEHPRKFVMPHMQDVRRHDAPEVGDRRSWGCNAYVYGVCLDLTDGKGFYEYDEIWDKLKEMTDESTRQDEDKKEIEVGDIIVIKDLEDIKRDGNYIGLDGMVSAMKHGVYFTEEMAEYCGKELEVVSVEEDIYSTSHHNLYKVKDQHWTYTDDMIAYVIKHEQEEVIDGFLILPNAEIDAVRAVLLKASDVIEDSIEDIIDLEENTECDICDDETQIKVGDIVRVLNIDEMLLKEDSFIDDDGDVIFEGSDYYFDTKAMEPLCGQEFIVDSVEQEFSMFIGVPETTYKVIRPGEQPRNSHSFRYVFTDNMIEKVADKNE